METNTKYEIRIRGHIDAHWMRHFEGLDIAQDPLGETIITGRMDQATLHGILSRIRDLGLELLLVRQAATQEYQIEENPCT
ncbi:MAG TPA: hypothetical protein VK897_20090 [Anaerolineales bacterium]|nr:hypothetical protein [Anaerolineales bacterium]